MTTRRTRPIPSQIVALTPEADAVIDTQTPKLSATPGLALINNAGMTSAAALRPPLANDTVPTVVTVVSADTILAGRLQQACGGREFCHVRALTELPAACHGVVLIDSACGKLPAWNDDFWRRLGANARWILLSSEPSDHECLDALGVGASGYAHAYGATETLRNVIDAAESGSVWVGRNVMSRLLKGVSYAVRRERRTDTWGTRLTTREREVALLAANGESNQFIAANLGVTERTVKAHLSLVFEKLGVADRLQLALKIHGIR